MHNSYIVGLVRQFSLSENQLKELNDEIKNLSEKLKNQKIKLSLFKEKNRTLESIHRCTQEDIMNYYKQIKELETKEKLNNEKLSKLREEKEELLKLKKHKAEENSIINKVNNLKELSESLGFKLIDSFEENEENKIKDNEQDNFNKNIIIKDIEEIKKKKNEYKLKFNELKKKCNILNEDAEQQKLIIDNYKQCLNDINQKMNIFNERLEVSINNENQINTDNDNNLEEIYNKMSNIFSSIKELDKIISDVKNIFGANIENLLNEIQENLINIDNKRYKNEEDLKKLINNIGNRIDEIQNICFIFEESKQNFYVKNKTVNKEMISLNEKVDLLNQKKTENEINNFLKNEIKEEDNNENNNNNDKDFLSQSFLFRVKDQSWKYKTHILFNDQEEDYIENFIDQPTLLRKNWHEICYVYDDYDVHDIYYDMKAVGLGRNSYFHTGFHNFSYESNIEIESFLINGEESPYVNKRYFIKFNLDLNNLETVKIYIRYKESKNLDLLPLEKIEERKIYRYEYYGLGSFLAGQMGKYSLILKGSFDIVNFEQYFLIKNEKNLNENEYFWGGRVPYGGKRTLIMLSKNKANWSFYSSSKVSSSSNFRRTSLFIPIEFVGGNNEIINITASSPQTSNIILDEEKRQYIVSFQNLDDNKGEFILKGEFQNRCKGEWYVDLTDEEVDRKIPEEDKLCKEQLKYIAKSILEDFDKNNKNNDFQFLDYMKIALWVKKNIKYDLNYSGRHDMTAIDIYNMRVGVCHHFTKLSNALLYSLGYKVMYISGYAVKNNKKFNRDSGHAWSLIKLNGKWYPFDSTWGIVSGKLPVGHIFGFFFNKGYNARGVDSIKLEIGDVIGTLIS